MENHSMQSKGAWTLEKAESDIVGLPAAAALLHVHAETLRRRAVAWGVPHKRLGTAWRFSLAALKAWMQEREAA